MIQPRWLTVADVLRIHEVVTKPENGGGLPGVRDLGLLESAVARPQNRHFYDGIQNPATLAVTYASGLTHNHVFFDGNKRVAFVAVVVFLGMHGLRIQAPEDDAEDTMRAFAAGAISEEELELWVRKWL